MMKIINKQLFYISLGVILLTYLTFMSSISDIFKTFKPESREPFNVDFFMSLENFNDRIWRDN